MKYKKEEIYLLIFVVKSMKTYPFQAGFEKRWSCIFKVNKEALKDRSALQSANCARVLKVKTTITKKNWNKCTIASEFLEAAASVMDIYWKKIYPSLKFKCARHVKRAGIFFMSYYFKANVLNIFAFCDH